MRRVVITGFGIVSCLGNDADSVTRSLRESLSGIRFREAYKEIGMRSQVAGLPTIDLDERIDRKARRFMGDSAAYAYVAMDDAIRSAGLSAEQVSNERVGLIAGSGGHSSMNQVEAADIAREKGVKRVGP
ncbi:MAG: beta-ketoacyl synthase N-terminal-like domain-containing protein, partial [Alcanivoracaceae bacterium]|nr:beta-ketoacyl synthase N-terminal-like domain-containing protein [Alcanivoracaceae bacterium]